MMDVNEIERIIRTMIRQELSTVMMGKVVSNETASRSTIIRASNDGPSGNIRSVQPFGLSSRATPGTPAFIVPVAFDHTNQNMLGHFDEAGKPQVNDGEIALYNAYGQQVYLSDGKIQIGSSASAENLVLGQQLKALLLKLLEFIASHTHPGIGSPPSNAADFESLKSSPVGDEKILSQISFTE